MMKVGGPAAANSSFTGFGARSIDELDKRTVKRCAVDDDHSRGELRAGRLGRNRSEDRSSALADGRMFCHADSSICWENISLNRSSANH